MSNDLIYRKYPFLVWLFTIVLGPFLLVSYKRLAGDRMSSILHWDEALFFTIIFGGIFSIPAAFIYFFAFNGFVRIIASDLYLKIVMIVFTTVSLWVTFFYLNSISAVIIE